MKVLIITGGKIDDDFAFSFLKDKTYDEIIAVDGGLAFCDRASLIPTHLVGDFDTIDTIILEKYIHQDAICVHQYVPEKDYTDTDIAVKLAISLICTTDMAVLKDENRYVAQGSCDNQIHILGATGTRLDHVMANLQMLKNIMEAGIQGAIIDANNYIEMIKGQRVLEKAAAFGKYISLIPVSMDLSGITLEGFKYPLNHACTHFGESLCVSNEIVEEVGCITIEEGMAWMILSRD